MQLDNIDFEIAVIEARLRHISPCLGIRIRAEAKRVLSGSTFPPADPALMISARKALEALSNPPSKLARVS